MGVRELASTKILFWSLSISNDLPLSQSVDFNTLVTAEEFLKPPVCFPFVKFLNQTYLWSHELFCNVLGKAWTENRDDVLKVLKKIANLFGNKTELKAHF